MGRSGFGDVSTAVEKQKSVGLRLRSIHLVAPAAAREDRASCGSVKKSRRTHCYTRRAVGSCNLFLSLGTSSVVYPAAGLIDLALKKGARILEVNPEETAYSRKMHWSIRGKSGEIMPQLMAAAFLTENWGDLRTPPTSRHPVRFFARQPLVTFSIKLVYSAVGTASVHCENTTAAAVACDWSHRTERRGQRSWTEKSIATGRLLPRREPRRQPVFGHLGFGTLLAIGHWALSWHDRAAGGPNRMTPFLQMEVICSGRHG